MSSARKSMSRPSRCSSASICTARSNASGAGSSTSFRRETEDVAVVGACGTGPEGLTSLCAMSLGISAWNRIDRKHRKAKTTRSQNPFIATPDDHEIQRIRKNLPHFGAPRSSRIRRQRIHHDTPILLPFDCLPVTRWPTTSSVRRVFDHPVNFHNRSVFLCCCATHFSPTAPENALYYLLGCLRFSRTLVPWW